MLWWALGCPLLTCPSSGYLVSSRRGCWGCFSSRFDSAEAIKQEPSAQVVGPELYAVTLGTCPGWKGFGSYSCLHRAGFPWVSVARTQAMWFPLSLPNWVFTIEPLPL